MVKVNDCKDQTLLEQNSIPLIIDWLKDRIKILGYTILSIQDVSSNKEYYHLGDIKLKLKNSWNGKILHLEVKVRTEDYKNLYKKDVAIEIWDDVERTRLSNIQNIGADYIVYVFTNAIFKPNKTLKTATKIYGGIIYDRYKTIQFIHDNWNNGHTFSKKIKTAINSKHRTSNVIVPWEIIEKFSLEKTIKHYI